MLNKTSSTMRFLSYITLLAFFPTSAGVWNFLPERLGVAYAEPDPQHSARHRTAFNRPSIEPLHTEQLKSIMGGPRPDLESSSHPLNLPKLAELVRKPSKIETDATANPLKDAQNRFKLAQREDAAEPDSPRALLNEADAFAVSGNLVDAALNYLKVLDEYPRTQEGLWASEGVHNIARAMRNGEIGEQSGGEIERRAPAFESLRSTEARYQFTGYYSVKAETMLESGVPLEEVAPIFRQCRDAAWASMQVDENNPLQFDVVTIFYESSEHLGGEDFNDAVKKLESYLADAPVSIARWAARFYLSQHWTTRGNNPGRAQVEYGTMLDELQDLRFEEHLADEFVYGWIKSRMEYAKAMALFHTYQWDLSEELCGNILSQYEGGEAVEAASFLRATILTSRSPQSATAGLNAFADFVNAHPQSELVPHALLRMAALYAQADDFSSALDVFTQISNEFPDSEVAVAAESAADNILRNQYGSVDIARLDATPEQHLAKVMCGPLALKSLLTSLHIPANEKALAKEAGTSESGTSMAGLIDAAKAHGVALEGVAANTVHELTTPFIAHINYDHFVLVTNASDSNVTVVDATTPPRELPLHEFSSKWNGKALVLSGSEGRRVDLASLASTMGGCTMPTFPIYDDSGCGVADPMSCNGGNDSGAGLRLVPDPGGPVCILPGCGFGSRATTAIASPGIEAQINVYQSSLHLTGSDLSIDLRGALNLSFNRIYVNEKGYHREEYTGATKPWKNNIGEGWTHNLNIHLRASSGNPASTVTLYDASGFGKTYTYATTAWGGNWYVRNNGTTEERGVYVLRDNTTLKWGVFFPSGLTYGFSTVTADADRCARIESEADASGNGITYSYDGAVGTGKLTKVAGPNGNAQHFQFSYVGNLITKAELKNDSNILQTTTYAYNASNELTKVTGNDGKDVKYDYASDPNEALIRMITKITDKVANEYSLFWGFVQNGSYYEANDIEVIDMEGLATRFTRNVSTGACTVTNIEAGTEMSKVITTPVSSSLPNTRYIDVYSDASNYTRWEYRYDASNNLTKSLSPGGETHKIFSYTSKGRLSTNTDSSGTSVTWDYVTDTNHPTKMNAPGGLATTISYDASNRITKVVTPWSGANGVQHEYGANGLKTKITSPTGNVISFAYDTYGRLTSRKDALNNETKFEFDALGNTTKITDPNSNARYYYYSSASCGGCGGDSGLLTKVKKANNDETTFEYDAHGNLTKETDSQNRITEQRYDRKNRLTKVVRSDSAEMIYAYTKTGLLTAETDYEGHTKNYFYNREGRLTKRTDAIGTIDEMAYDSKGRLSLVKDGGGNAITYHRDSNGVNTKISYADGKSERFLFDGQGRMTKHGAGASGTIDPVEQFFDNTTGLVTKYRYTAGGNTSDVVFAYRPNGAVTKVTEWIDNVDGLRYGFDNNGRITKITDYDDSTLDYTYDTAGNVLSMDDYHGNLYTYTYTNLNTISTITAPGPRVWDFDYNSIHQLTKYSSPNGVDTHHSYDSLGRLSKIEYKDGSTVLDAFIYQFDLEGNITHTEQKDPATTYWDYQYDARERLTLAERKNAASVVLKRWTYTYSPAENMTTKAVWDGSTTTSYVYSHTPANELTKQSVGGTDTLFAYDDWGRLTSKTQGGYAASYYWNYAGKLTKAASSFPGEGTVEYEYGGDGLLRERISSGVTTWYNNDAKGKDIGEENGSGTLQMSYVNHPSRAFGAVLADLSTSNPASGTPRYYSADVSGSTRRLRDTSKSSLASYEYEPYGDTFSATGASIQVKYTGHIMDDASGLYRTIYRQFSPLTSRWVSRDPIGRADGPNLFAGMQNSPMSNIDPLGLSCCKTVRNHPEVDPTAFGFVACCGGQKKVCVMENRIRAVFTNERAGDLAVHCIALHERVHMEDPTQGCRPLIGDLGIGAHQLPLDFYKSECAAYDAAVGCAKTNKRAYCGSREDCREQVEKFLTGSKAARKHHCDCIATPILCAIREK